MNSVILILNEFWCENTLILKILSSHAKENFDVKRLRFSIFQSSSSPCSVSTSSDRWGKIWAKFWNVKRQNLWWKVMRIVWWAGWSRIQALKSFDWGGKHCTNTFSLPFRWWWSRMIKMIEMIRKMMKSLQGLFFPAIFSFSAPTLLVSGVFYSNRFISLKHQNLFYSRTKIYSNQSAPKYIWTNPC